VFKRGLDVLASAILLFFALPLLLLLALVIKLTSPGPVLFRQKRVGRNFQVFEILKLRTMAHAQAGLAYTLGPDPRITPFGKWLRRTKLDELPQLWNVLRGEMSLVGPRPVIPEITAEYRSRYALLLRGRPGLTDPASLKYSQEAQFLSMARDPVDFFKTVVIPDKLYVSLQYMEKANPWTDILTLCMTIIILCFPSMSRVYGDLPNATPTLAGLEPQRVSRIDRRPVSAKVHAFPRESAEREARQKKTLETLPSQTILLQISSLRKQSAPSASPESASRL